MNNAGWTRVRVSNYDQIIKEIPDRLINKYWVGGQPKGLGHRVRLDEFNSNGTDACRLGFFNSSIETELDRSSMSA